MNKGLIALSRVNFCYKLPQALEMITLFGKHYKLIVKLFHLFNIDNIIEKFSIQFVVVLGLKFCSFFHFS